MSFSFGGAAAAAPKPAGASPFSFGTPAPAPAASTPTFSFAGAASSSPQQPASGFGQPQAQPTQASSPFSFGAPAAAAPKPPATGLFGGSLFGATQPQAQQQQQPAATTSTFGGFGGLGASQQQQQGLSVSQLGQSTSNAGGFNGNASSAPSASTVIKREDMTVEQRIESIKSSWDPTSPACRFQSYFYNAVEPNEVQYYGRPQNATDDAAWFKAQRENPDPSRMVPALAVGFDDIRKRSEVQMKMAGAHWAKLQEISQRLKALNSPTTSSSSAPSLPSTAPASSSNPLTVSALGGPSSSASNPSDLPLSLRLARAQSLQSNLTHRTLLLIRNLHLVIPSLRSTSLRREEEQLLERLEALVDELSGGASGGAGGRGTGSVRGRMMELWALVGAVKGERERAGRDGAGGAASEQAEGWAVVDDEAMERLAKIISDQQLALAHLTKVLKSDSSAIEVMRQGLGLVNATSSSSGDARR